MLFGPNGEQCVECANWMNGCFELEFKSMKVIQVYPEDSFKMVVCTNYVKHTPVDNESINKEKYD